MHRLNRPLPFVTCHFLFPVMSHFRGKGQTGHKGQQVELSEQVSCLKWAMWGIGMGSADTVWGRSRSELLGLWLWTPRFLAPSPFHHIFSFSFFDFLPVTLHVRVVALCTVGPLHAALMLLVLVCGFQYVFIFFMSYYQYIQRDIMSILSWSYPFVIVWYCVWSPNKQNISTRIQG